MIILIGGEKGGTGKTTLATSLAANRALAGRDVLLIDTDTQGSASYWAQSRGESEARPRRVACVQKFGKGLQAEVLADFASLDLAGTAVRDRIAYRKAAREGLCVDELRPRDAKAVEEMQALYEEAFRCLGPRPAD